MGFLNKLVPKRASKDAATEVPNTSVGQTPANFSYAPSLAPADLQDEAFNTLRYEIMILNLHQQQQQRMWTTLASDEGVILKKAKGSHVCVPRGLEETGEGLTQYVEALNVKATMTLRTPLIEQFSQRETVSLKNGQEIQVLENLSYLPKCQKYQCAAFIQDRGMLVVWDDDPTALVSHAARLEQALIDMVWHRQADEDMDYKEKRSPTVGITEVSSMTSSRPGSPRSGLGSMFGMMGKGKSLPTSPLATGMQTPAMQSDTALDNVPDVEAGPIKHKNYSVKLLLPCVVGATLALAFFCFGLGFQRILSEVMTDHSYTRFGLLLVLPLQCFVSLFFFQVLITSACQLAGPIKQVSENSKFYCGVRPKRLHRSTRLPHITIQMPVYKEGLAAVIIPTIRSIKAAISTYEMQGGSANIFVNDDGMQFMPPDLARARAEFYDENGIGWVARPKHNLNGEDGDVFIRRGKFKKASNMNYAMAVSTRVEDHLVRLLEQDGWHDDEEAYEEALRLVIKEDEGRTWAQGNIRMGDYILLIDSDTRVPQDCLLDSVSEMEQNPQCAILQHNSDVMNVTDSYFENGITWFTRLVYSQIKYVVAAGDIAPFVGHNAFLRWSAVQFISYDCPLDNREKWWSEATVSEDFDMALRLQRAGYLVRLATFESPDGEFFREGVSLTVYDELTRWEKYAYGSAEMIFHPFKDWPRHGPITKLFRQFLTSCIPLSSKFTLLAYLGTYYALGYTWIASLANFFLWGWYRNELDHFYIQSFNLYCSITVVFTFAGPVCLAVMRFREGSRGFLSSLFENLKWVPFITLFMGGVSLHISQALLCHLFSIDMSWAATSKEVVNTTFFAEIPLVFKKFKFTFVYCIVCSGAMIACAVAVPDEWRITSITTIWPLAVTVACHFLLPIVLNPSLMFFTW